MGIFDNWIEVFKAGKHVDASGQVYEFTKEDVKQLAETFDKKRYRVPVVVGHPKVEDPAFGWVSDVKEENGSLFVKLGNLVKEFVDAVERGLYRERSISIYHPDSPNNHHKGKWTLKHIGFLGAAAPAVKGLAPLGFTDDVNSIEFKFSESDWKIVTIGGIFRRLREWLIGKFGQEDADMVIPNWEIENLQQPPEPEIREENFSEIKEEITMNEREELEKLKAELKAKEELIAQQEAKIKFFAEIEKKRKEEAKKQKIISFAENLIKTGRLLPAQKEDFIAIANELSEENEIAFSEGKKSSLDGFFCFLEKIPENIFVDVSGKEKYTKERAETKEFSESDSREDLHKKVLETMKQNKELSYAEALEIVLKSKLEEETYV